MPHFERILNNFAIPNLDLVVVHAMNYLFGMSKSEANGCIVSGSFISFCSLIHHLQSNPSSYNPILIIGRIIFGYYLFECDKSILGLMDGKVLSILSQIDVEMNLTPKLVAPVVLAKTLNGMDKVKVNRNAQFGGSVLVLQVRVDFCASEMNNQFSSLNNRFCLMNSQSERHKQLVFRHQ